MTEMRPEISSHRAGSLEPFPPNGEEGTNGYASERSLWSRRERARPLGGVPARAQPAASNASAMTPTGASTTAHASSCRAPW
jgi:hypothetical protein